MDKREISRGEGLLALSPVSVFLGLYVVVSVLIRDFYCMPISVALVGASMWGVAMFRGRSLRERIEVYSRAAGHSNILYMLWVFILAGAFTAVAKGIGSVDATVNLIVSVCDARYIVAMLFVASCFISFSIGTSVGTVVALAPLGLEMAQVTGGDIPFFIASVLGGAFFGDNLSIISDTTIAATRSQGCDMRDKLKANLWIALPAALVTLGVYLLIAAGKESVEVAVTAREGHWWLILPYLTVILAAVAGINVILVMTLGISVALIIGAFSGNGLIDMASVMGEGIASMGELIIITLLASGMLGIIKAAGGIHYLLDALTRRLSGRRGAQSVIVLLVGVVNLCTANNTVAIITVGSIARNISDKFHLDSRKVASLLDSASCVVQSIIPYGAQTLLATSLAGISPTAPLASLYYSWALAAMIALSIIFLFPRRLNHRPIESP